MQAHFEVGFGNQMSFWQNKWCGDQPLKDVGL